MARTQPTPQLAAASLLLLFLLLLLAPAELVSSEVSGGAGFLCSVSGVVPRGGGVPALFCWPHAAPSAWPRTSSASARRTTVGT
ncbi:hypothetical protein ZWY2020_000809 [Hordeum vulgare]|nr:hypothetical protein ZWY2020_000809 [Hordeum vulgare]